LFTSTDEDQTMSFNENDTLADKKFQYNASSIRGNSNNKGCHFFARVIDGLN